MKDARRTEQPSLLSLIPGDAEVERTAQATAEEARADEVMRAGERKLGPEEVREKFLARLGHLLKPKLF